MPVKRERNINIQALKLGNIKMKSGWFEDSVYPDGTKAAMVAAISEHGTENIPPRPIIRPTVEREKNNWKSFIKDGSRRVLNGEIESFSEGFGLQVQGDIQATIAQIQSPELAESTIKARQSKLADGKTVGSLDKPLVETGYLLSSVKSK